MPLIELTVNDEYSDMRLDRFVFKSTDCSKVAIQKLIRKGDIKLNGKRVSADTAVKSGDKVKVYGAALKTADAVSFDGSVGSLDILYEDDFILAINKPTGLATQPSQSKTDCLSERIKFYLKDIIIKSNYRFVPAPVNRLDFETSGIVLCGKTPKAAKELSELIREGDVDKQYYALCFGNLPQKIRLENYALKDSKHNKMCLYDYHVDNSVRMDGIYTPIAKGKDISLINAKLITGKTHQIRAQLAYIGAPVVNDYKYGNRVLNDNLKKEQNVNRLCLHCYETAFDLWYAPGDIKITCDMPSDLKKVCIAEGIDISLCEKIV